MRRSSVLLLALAACRHVPPDKEARAVVPPPPAARTPERAELLGAWRSVVLRGALAELGHTAVYVFAEGGAYTGALVSERECTPIGGAWGYENGQLTLDDGALVFSAGLVDDRLTLSAGDTYVELVRLGGPAPR
jgi:hypothetical protein